MGVLKGNKYFYDYEVTSALGHNLREWLDYGLLEMGAYTIVKYNDPFTSGFTNLKRTKNDNYAAGRIYEGMGPGWVWQHDISPISPSGNTLATPLVASGVKVNGTFYLTSTTSGTYSHKIDFRSGRVIFASGLSSSDTVTCEYTFKDVGIYGSESNEWKRIVQYAGDKYKAENSSSPSGMFQILKQNRIYPPCVIVQVNNRTNSPLQLGGGEIATFDVDFHIFSDQASTNAKLADVISNQYDQTLRLFDINSIQFPFKGDGTLVDNPLTYKQLATDTSPYFWTFARVSETDGGWRDSETDVFRAECNYLIEVPRYLITY